MVQDDALVCPHCRHSLKTNWPFVAIGLALGIVVVIVFGELS